MYKYKKTIIINNRRRRIFSKEKSNTEYILYKNEYITLNAYNKKTDGGGGLGNYLQRKIKGEKDEFQIPYNDEMWNSSISKVNQNLKLNLPLNNFIKLDKYFMENINDYHENISKIISTYLKSKRHIPDSNDKLWIITKYTGNTGKPIEVKGYTQIEWDAYLNERNTEEWLIKYGQENNITYKTYYETYYNDILKKNNKPLYYYKLVNADGLKVYNKLNTENYYIYIIIQFYDTNVYNESENYLLYKGIFKCDKIYIENIGDGGQRGNENVTTRYTIIFRYISSEDKGGRGKYK